MRRLRQPTSLRWRLAGAVTAVVLVCTAIAFAAVYSGTGTELRRQIDGDIAGESHELAHSLTTSGARTPAQLAAAARAYVAAQPFSVDSNVLMVAVPGQPLRTNRPEFFEAQPPDQDESQAEQDHEDELASALAGASLGYHTMQAPDIGQLRLLERSVRLANGLTARIATGEPLQSVSRAQRGVARTFLLAGLLALVGALLASYLIGTRFTRRLRAMAGVAALVDAGDLHPRIVSGGARHDEIEVLADAFNRMLDRLTEAFAVQRAFVADASHELRTPLTVIRGQLEVLAAQSEPSGEEVRRVERLLQGEVARINRLVDDLLLLARAEQTEFLMLERFELAPFVEDLWDAISLLAERRYELGPLPPGTLRADPDRLAQALRNLLVNAIDHTAAPGGLVRLAVEARPGARVRFVVEDDGPGIAPEQRLRIFDRFHRTDAARDRASGGAGLGLAIVRAIAEAHGGTVTALAAARGGARLELELPGFAQTNATVAAGREPVEAPAAGADPERAATAGVSGD